MIWRADRIEALVMLVALVVSLVAIPLVGVADVAVYSARHSRYAQEAHERHTVMATITEAEKDGSTVVRASWPAAAGERIGSLELRTAAKVGERTEIWVSKDGNWVAPPSPAWYAVGDAVVMAEAALLLVGIGMTSLVAGVRSRLDRVREAQWERELRCLQEDGGRTNQH